MTETTSLESGEALWDWVVCSNPLVEDLLGSLPLDSAERAAIRSALERRVRQRAGSGAAATLGNPVNIGIGTK